MDRVMVRVSSAKASLAGRFSPTRSYALATMQSQPHSTFSFQMFAYLLCALCGVFLVAHFIFTASESSRALRSSLRSVPAEAILHAQLIEKEREIEKLRWEIDHIRKGVHIKETSMSEREGVIQQLKNKARLEHEAKTKAELALSDRAGALHECQQQKTALAGEVAQCHFDLQAVLGAGSRVVSQQSSAALAEMSRRAQDVPNSSSGSSSSSSRRGGGRSTEEEDGLEATVVRGSGSDPTEDKSSRDSYTF